MVFGLNFKYCYEKFVEYCIEDINQKMYYFFWYNVLKFIFAYLNAYIVHFPEYVYFIFCFFSLNLESLNMFFLIEANCVINYFILILININNLQNFCV